MQVPSSPNMFVYKHNLLQPDSANTQLAATKKSSSSQDIIRTHDPENNINRTTKKNLHQTERWLHRSRCIPEK
jgi:hypothetical protein